MARVSYGSRETSNAHGMHTRKGLPRGPCASLEQLTQALREDIDAGMESVLPECTTAEFSLDLHALVPLHRPNIGPYADGGEHDLPPEFKTSWTIADDDTSGRLSLRKAHPQASVESIIAIDDPHTRQSVQRAASRGIVAALEAIDGFKYSFNNAWAAKDEDGQRFSYICQDSMQNKDRHANGFTRTQKHLKGDGERGVRKPTYDCKGSVSVKCSSNRRCIDVYYRHYAIHPTVGERKSLPRRPPPKTNSFDAFGGVEPAPPPRIDTGGLRGMLQAEESAYSAPPSTQVTPIATQQQQPSNIGKPLKRKRDSDAPPNPHVKESGPALSLVDLLKQSQAAKARPKPSPKTPKTSTNMYPPPMNYALPSWQEPPPVPVQRPIQQAASGQHGPPYPPPYQPDRPQQPAARTSMPPPPPRPLPPPPSQLPPLPPPQQYFGPPQPHPKGQSMFSTLKSVAPDTPLNTTIPYWSPRSRTSCTNCRISKKRCDEQRPFCGGCQRVGKYDCVYEGAYDYAPSPAPGALAPTAPVQVETNVSHVQPQPPREESPDPWFPKR